jgi:hypothetical protein
MKIGAVVLLVGVVALGACEADENDLRRDGGRSEADGGEQRFAPAEIRCGVSRVLCSPGQVCSGGACRETCLEPLFQCNGQCVDLDKDSLNCGVCGHPCEQHRFCQNGICSIQF